MKNEKKKPQSGTSINKCLNMKIKKNYLPSQKHNSSSHGPSRLEMSTSARLASTKPPLCWLTPHTAPPLRTHVCWQLPPQDQTNLSPTINLLTCLSACLIQIAIWLVRSSPRRQQRYRLHHLPFPPSCACSCCDAYSSCWAPSFAPCPAVLEKAAICRLELARALC